VVPRLIPLLLLAALSRAAGADDVADDDTESEPVCGNGQIEGTEECDDGNSREHDGCDAACQTEPLWGCGDLVLTPAIECDDDEVICMPTCQVDSY
jgi:cysteine-rich repeat protein